jgi:hypothetical protein
VSDWIAVLGTLAGTIVGSASTYINQRFQARQAARTQLEDARRATYADFLTQTHNIYLAIRAIRQEHKDQGDEAVYDINYNQLCLVKLSQHSTGCDTAASGQVSDLPDDFARALPRRGCAG